MKERPLIFTGDSVRAILAGRKTQTRRLVRETRRLVREPIASTLTSEVWPNVPPLEIAYVAQRCPHGVGDRLWVKESWASVDHRGEWAQSVRIAEEDDRILYRADDERLAAPLSGGRWLTPLYMPRWASRITLEVTTVRVERLKDISDNDARAEGVESGCYAVRQEPCVGALSFGCQKCGRIIGPDTPRTMAGAFARAWDGINGKRAPWATNPWVWAISFRRVEAEARRSA